MAIRSTVRALWLTLPLLMATSLTPSEGAAAQDAGSSPEQLRQTAIAASSELGPGIWPGGQLERASASAASDGSRRIPSEWLGRYCTPLGCKGPETSPLASGAGFAAAILVGGWLARRRTGPAD